ncbi:hypothetical protein BMS3Abin07_01301 [bacterium BMS3Abin07]|nr:hypothetical protein BMS3Abin07_01301 [bacterium BMS3Abin07]GBE33145.1 hypothetical protein BMS3Bbin05_02083 [bacterium BMS3Bbin05]HDL20404.1 DUF86 domain-containing protein [Nitrospirota bacterium]HDO22629.1 DUF86 domain-containing protein [Nitrospirota bacterium]HDZ87062.1 DUF86 domain-containing protein [Nitrospirota bacterium]
MVDASLIGRKIAELEGYLAQIAEYKAISVREYKKDWKTQRIIERTLHLMIELCIDIANHVISDKGLRVPSSYADAFRVLMENGIIRKSLFNRLEKMAKFRNIIVHQYEQVDPEIVVSILKNNLRDFEEYKKAILKTISEKNK